LKFENTEAVIDITPKNILHHITELKGSSKDKVLYILGDPIKILVLNTFNKPHDLATAPQYLVYPVKWRDVETKFISKEARLINFSKPLNISHPLEDLSTPSSYRSLELILEKKASFSSGFWALGCTLFEIRTGRKLFAPFDDEDGDYLDAMVQVLVDSLSLSSLRLRKRGRRLYIDDVDECGNAVATFGSEPSKMVQGRTRTPVLFTSLLRAILDHCAIRLLLGSGTPMVILVKIATEIFVKEGRKCLRTF
jgi:serine/threonine protein kinase